MWAFIARRLAAAVPVMIGITFVAFVLIHLVPGSPAKVILYGSQATPQQIANLTSQLGLDQPWWEQYTRFLGQLLRGNLGTSYLTQTSVAHELLSRTPSTLILTGSAMVVAIVIGVPLGVLAGARPGSFLDRAARGISFLGVAIPYFFLALLLVLTVSWVFVRSSPSAVDNTFRSMQLVSAALYSLGHGGNDAQKTMGVIAVLLYSQGLLGETFYIPFWVILSCQAAMGLGTLVGGWRIVRTMGTRITRLHPVQGFCAEAGGAMTLFLVTYFGIPVSTTHTITGAIVGVGAARKTAAVRWNVASDVILAWIVTLPATALFGAAFYELYKLLS